jgi:hypothetical protein
MQRLLESTNTDNPVTSDLSQEVEALARAAVDMAVQEHTASEAYLSGKPRVLRWCSVLVRQTAFDYFIIAVITANIVALAYDHHGISDAAVEQLSAANIAFSIVFGLEMVLKVAGTPIWHVAL